MRRAIFTALFAASLVAAAIPVGMAQLSVQGLRVAPPKVPGNGGVTVKGFLSTTLPGEIASLQKSGDRIVVRLADGKALALKLEGLALKTEPITQPPPQPLPPDALPGAIPASAGDVVLAYLARPTPRYVHGVLGGKDEAGALVVKWRDGTSATLALPPDSVFEDRRVRLVDVDGDGTPEALVVRSYLDRGSALAVYKLRPGHIEPFAESAPLGKPQRWLDPVGAADLDGDGRTEIVVIERPHLDGTLRIYGLVDGKLVSRASAAGYSNHRAGSGAIGMAALIDLTRSGHPDIVVGDIDRACLKVLAFGKGALREAGTISCGEELSGDFLVADIDHDGREDLLVPRARGRLELVLR